MVRREKFEWCEGLWFLFRAFDVELLFIAEKLRIPISEVDVNWQEIPGSKLDPFTASFQMGIDILAIWIRYLLGIWKIQYKNH